MLGPPLPRITRIVLHAWFDRIPRRGHLHPFCWDHASEPEARARYFFTRFGALEKMLGFVVRDRMEHREGPNLVERVVTDLTQLSSKSTPHEPSRARSCRERRTAHGVVLTFLEKPKMLLDDGNVAPFLQIRPAPVGRRTGPMHQKDVTRQDLGPRTFSHSGSSRRGAARGPTSKLRARACGQLHEYFANKTPATA